MINPFIEGQSFTSSKKMVQDAGEDIWMQFSSNVKNYTPKFYFSIKNTKDNKLYHFKGGNVKTQLTKFDKNKKNIDKILLSELNNLRGGKRVKYNDDSSSSSSSSSDDYLSIGHRSNMLSLTYYPSIYGVRNILLPAFTSSFTPYLNINFPLLNHVIITP